MADERDPKLAQHYRELEALEPPADLDQKILAAARDAESPHAPLVAPAGRHRWYYPLAAAAVLVFAVALTLHMERDRPDPEAVSSASVRGEIKPVLQPEAKQRVEKQEAKPVPRAAQPAQAFAPDPGARAADQANLERARIQAEQARVAAEASRGDALRQEVESARMSAARSMASAQKAAPAAAPPENPERWLDRIADLRSRGRNAEADRELAAFRKAYPNYQLSDPMRKRVEGTSTPSR